METNVVFEQKISIGPRDFNTLGEKKLDDILLEKFETENSGRCSVHGWVKPGTMKMLSRSMMQIEGGRFTGDMICWVQVEGRVIYPVDGARLRGIVMKKNKMGMFVMYDEAIQVMVPRDLHVGTDDLATEFDAVQIGELVEVEVKKSRFQVRDQTILSVGIFKQRLKMGAALPAKTAAATALVDEEAPAVAATTPESEGDEEEKEEEASSSNEEEEADDGKEEEEVEINLDAMLAGEQLPEGEQAQEEDDEDEASDKITLRE